MKTPKIIIPKELILEEYFENPIKDNLLEELKFKDKPKTKNKK